jgi:hypothetical protein
LRILASDLANSQKQLRQGLVFTGDMMILLRILVRDWQTIQLPRPQGGEFTIDTYFVFGEWLHKASKIIGSSLAV